MDREQGQMYTLTAYMVQGDGTDSKGRTVKNPRIFGYPKKNPTKKGLSVKVKKVVGFGQVDHLEIVCYGDSFADARKLKLKTGDLIDCHGRFQIDQGKKHPFPKIVINDPMQIRRFSFAKFCPTGLRDETL